MTDLDQVTFDLEPVSLEEVLEFRAEHGEEHRAYARELGAFVRSLAALDEADRQAAWLDRGEALDDMAAQLRRHARRAWRRPWRTSV